MPSFTLTKSVNMSGSEFETGIYQNYQLRMFHNNMLSNITAYRDYLSGNEAPRCKVDGDNNHYIVKNNRGETSTQRDGISITKFSGDNLNNTNIVWSKGFRISSKSLTIYDFDVSHYGLIGVVGEDTVNDDGFVLIVDTGGTVRLFHTWRTYDNGRDLALTSCFWHGSFNNEPSLQVHGSQGWYGWGGSPWRSGFHIQYGNGTSTKYSDYVYSRAPHYIMGTSSTDGEFHLQQHRPEPHPADSQWMYNSTSSDYSGSCHGTFNYGNGTADNYQVGWLQLRAYPYASTFARMNFNNVDFMGNTSYKVYHSSSLTGRVKNLGTVYAGQSLNRPSGTPSAAYYSLFYVRPVYYSSSSNVKHTMMLVKHNGSTTVWWTRQWECGSDNVSTGFTDGENPYSNFLTDIRSHCNIFLAKNDLRNTDDTEGVVVCYKKTDGSKIALLHFDRDGNAIKQVDVGFYEDTANSGTDAMPIYSWSISRDNLESMILCVQKPSSISNRIDYNMCMRLPPMKLITSSNLAGTLDHYTQYTDNVTINTSAVPTIYNQTSNYQQQTAYGWNYYYEYGRSGTYQYPWSNYTSTSSHVMTDFTTNSYIDYGFVHGTATATV